jgi:hypothetical protein
MRTFSVVLVVLALVAATARAEEVCGGQFSEEMAITDAEAILIQTIDNVYVVQDYTVTQPMLRLYNDDVDPEIEDFLTTSLEDGTLTVQPKGGNRAELCAHLVLPGPDSQDALSTLIVNDDTNMTFSGAIQLPSLYLHVISGSFYADNTTQMTIDSLTFNATGQGSGTFEHEFSAVSELVVAISGNSNYTYLGGVGTGSVSVTGQGDVVLGPVLTTMEVALTSMGDLIAEGSPGAVFVGEVTMPNLVKYVEGQCEVQPGQGASPTYNACVQLTREEFEGSSEFFPIAGR